MFLRQLRWICPGFGHHFQAKVIYRTLCSSSDGNNSSMHEAGVSESTRDDAPVVYRHKHKQIWQKEAENFMSNLDEEGLKKKRELELTIEMWRHDKYLIPDEITPLNWKILLTECQGFIARQNFLRYLYDREQKTHFRNRHKDYARKRRLFELDDKEKPQLFLFPWNDEQKSKWWKGIQAMKSEIPVIIDFGFETELREQRRAYTQLQMLMTYNLTHLQPLSLHLTSICKNFRVKNIPHEGSGVFATTHESHFLDIFPHENLVYLSSDGPPMTEFDQKYTFVIGGIEDQMPKPNLTLDFAKSHGIRCASLPVMAYYKHRPGVSKVLSFSCVYKILLDMYLNKSWEEAFHNHLPSAFILQDEVATEKDLQRRNEVIAKQHHTKLLRATDRVLNILTRNE